MRFFKKKWFKIFGSCFVILSVGVGITTYFWLTNFQKKDISPTKNKKYIVSIEGAVEKPGDYEFDKPSSLRTIVFRAILLNNADVSNVNLEKVINQDEKIFIPFEIGTIKKLKWSEFTNVNQLIKLGIKKATAQKLLDFRRKNSKPTWEQIHAIKGIGQITLNQLKEVIDLS